MFGDIFYSTIATTSNGDIGDFGLSHVSIEDPQPEETQRVVVRSESKVQSDHYYFFISGLILVVYLLSSGSLWPFMLKAVFFLCLLLGILIMAFFLTGYFGPSDGTLLMEVMTHNGEGQVLTQGEQATSKNRTTKAELLEKARRFRKSASYFHNSGLFSHRDLANSQAAQCLQLANNKDRPLNEIDVNGLLLEEAKEYVQKRVIVSGQVGFGFAKVFLEARRSASITACCHSGHKTASLKWPVASFIRRNLGLSCYEDPNDVSSLIVVIAK